MVDLFGITPLGQHGGRRPGAGRPRKGQPRQEKTGGNLKSGHDRSEYVIRRLARDARLGCREAAVLLEGVHTGKISAFAAGVEMSYTRRREPTGRGSENVTKRNDWAMHRNFLWVPFSKI